MEWVGRDGALVQGLRAVVVVLDAVQQHSVVVQTVCMAWVAGDGTLVQLLGLVVLLPDVSKKQSIVAWPEQSPTTASDGRPPHPQRAPRTKIVRVGGTCFDGTLVVHFRSLLIRVWVA